MEMLTADYLILLVGTNPIPNFISSIAFNKPGCTIYLLHTPDNGEGYIGTKRIAENIKDLVIYKNSSINVKLLECDKSDAQKIECTLKKIIDEINLDKSFGAKTIHLNYTGGTKSMASHAYAFLKKMEAEDYGKFKYILSYIDSELNSLIYEKDGQVYKMSLDEIGSVLQISLQDIFNIHGYMIEEDGIIETKNDVEIIKDLKVKKKYGNENPAISFDAVYRYNFIICCKRRTDKRENKNCKMELFMLKDNANRVCGDQTKLCLVSDIKDKQRLALEIDDFYKSDFSNNIKIIAHYEDDDECIIKWMKGR